jgi:voltage-gated potassium channel
MTRRQTVDGGMMALALLSVPLTLVELRMPVIPDGLMILDWLVWAAFLVEFTVTFSLADNRSAYVRSHWLNLAIVVVSLPALPSALAFTRALRLVRTLAFMVRALAGLRATAGRRRVLYMSGGATFVIMAAAALMSVIEPAAVGGGNLGDAIWWAVVTASTVGYGDIAPHSGPGRIVAGVLMIGGIGLVSTLAGSIAASFVGHEETEVVTRLAMIESQLAQLLQERG